jgi:valyl-tRNA synthetase
MAAQGRDIKLAASRVEGYRNFATKLWNACRFAEINECAAVADFDPAKAKETLNRWIAHETARATREATEAIEAYRFNDAAGAIYRFVWNVYCDWYLELAKPVLMGEEGDAKSETRATVAWARDEILKLLHPFMPFITEELWHAVYDGEPPAKSIALSSYPLADEAQINTEAETEMAILQDLIVSVRNIRAELKVEQKAKLPVEIFAEPAIRSLVERNSGALERLANVESITFVEQSLAKVANARSTARFEVRVVYERKVDVAAERERLTKELAKLTGELARGTAQLGNEAFLSKAPAKVVEGLKKRKAEVEVLVEKANAALGELG